MIETINSVQRRIKVTVPVEAVGEAFEGVFRGLQKKAHLQGFRPGKAPIAMIKKVYGAHAASEVIDKLINRHLFQALDEHKIRPIGAPVVENISTPAHDQPFEFSAIVDVWPEIKLGNYKGLSVSAPSFAIDAARVDKELAGLQRRLAKTKAAPEGTAAATGHMVSMGHKAYRGTDPIPKMNVEEFSVTLGEGQIFADLEFAVIGMLPGETKEVTVTLPENYGDANLAGAQVRFEIDLKGVQEVVLPNLDDELAKDLEYQTLAELRETLETRLKEEGDKRRRQALENALLDQILEQSPFEVPPAMVDSVIDSMITELPSQNPKDREKLMRNEEVRKHFLAGARRKAQNTLLLWQIAQAENIQVTDEDITSRITQGFAGSGTTLEDVQMQKYVKEWGPRLRENMLLEKAVTVLADSAKITDIPTEL